MELDNTLLHDENATNDELVDKNGHFTENALKKIAEIGICLRVMGDSDEFGKQTTGDAHTIYDQDHLDEISGSTQGEKYFKGLVEMVEHLQGETNLSGRVALISEPSEFKSGAHVGGYENNTGESYFPFGKMGRRDISPINYLKRLSIVEGNFDENHKKIIASQIQKSILEILTGKKTNNDITEGKKDDPSSSESETLAELQWRLFSEALENSANKLLALCREDDGFWPRDPKIDFINGLCDQILHGRYLGSRTIEGYFETTFISHSNITEENLEEHLLTIFKLFSRDNPESSIIKDPNIREEPPFDIKESLKLLKKNRGLRLPGLIRGDLAIFLVDNPQNKNVMNLIVRVNIDKYMYEGKERYDQKQKEISAKKRAVEEEKEKKKTIKQPTTENELPVNPYDAWFQQKQDTILKEKA